MSFQDITKAPCKPWCDLWINQLHTLVPVAGATGPTGGIGPTGPSGSSVTGPTGPTGTEFTIGAPLNPTNSNVLSFTGGVLQVQYANSSYPGVLSMSTQNIVGDKNFSGIVSTPCVFMPITTAVAVGTIQINAIRYFHGYGLNNVFAGPNAGNYTLTGASTVGIGLNVLQNITTGTSNTVVGAGSGRFLDTGSSNAIFGAAAAAIATSASQCVILGQLAAVSLTTGTNIIAIGRGSLPSATTQTGIIEISDGTIGDSNSNDIRIGMSTSTACYIRGIAGVSGGTGNMVYIDETTHQLKSQPIDDFSNITSSNFTATLDSGSITSMTVRGVSTTTIPLGFTKVGSQVTMTIPTLSLISQSGTASTINLTGVSTIPILYRPTYNSSFIISVLNDAAFTTGIVYITSGGAVTLQVGPAFTLPTGLSYDANVTWNIV